MKHTHTHLEFRRLIVLGLLSKGLAANSAAAGGVTSPKPRGAPRRVSPSSDDVRGGGGGDAKRRRRGSGTQPGCARVCVEQRRPLAGADPWWSYPSALPGVYLSEAKIGRQDWIPVLDMPREGVPRCVPVSDVFRELPYPWW